MAGSPGVRRTRPATARTVSAASRWSGPTAPCSCRSIDGGTSWRSTVLVSTVSHHNAAGGLREEALPAAEIDGAGTAYVAWSDCRFRSGCPANDVVLSRSTSETTWGPVARVPIDAASSAADYFVPGVGVAT